MRLERRFRIILYGIFAALFATGAAWLIANQLKDAPRGELWQQISANLLMAHGGAAMVALLLLGALGPVHVKRGWRTRRNRVTGALMVTLNSVLILTAFALYYLASESFRPWMSDIHLALGLGLPAFLLSHVWIGKRDKSRERR